MKRPPPKPERLRPHGDISPETYRIARLRIPLWRHAFVALFDHVARQNTHLARLFADHLTEAAQGYRHSTYSSRRARRDDLRVTFLMLRRLDLRQGKQGKNHDWFTIYWLGRQVFRVVREWMNQGNPLNSRSAAAQQIAELLRPLGIVDPVRISRILAGTRQAQPSTLQFLALAVYGPTGTGRQIKDGVLAILGPVNRDRLFEAETLPAVSVPSSVSKYHAFDPSPRPQTKKVSSLRSARSSTRVAKAPAL